MLSYAVFRHWPIYRLPSSYSTGTRTATASPTVMQLWRIWVTIMYTNDWDPSYNRSEIEHNKTIISSTINPDKYFMGYITICIINSDMFCGIVTQNDVTNLGYHCFLVMAWRLFCAKPLPEPMQNYCQLNPQEHNSVKFQSKYSIQKNAFEKCRLIKPDMQWHDLWLMRL